jgi:hypothetical protein
MLTLTQVKQEIGIDTPDSGDDPELSRLVRQVIHRIRQITMRGIAWTCDRVESVGSKARLRVIGHGFRTGQTAKIRGSGLSALDNATSHTLTVINQDTIELTVDGQLLECHFTVHPLATELVTPINADRVWVPEKLTPLLEVKSIDDLIEVNTWEEISSSDYFFEPSDVRGKKIVEVVRDEGTFLIPMHVRRGQYALRTRSNQKTVRISAWTGSDIPPEEIVMAGTSLICDLHERRGTGKDRASYSFEDVQRTGMTGEERMACLVGPTSPLNSWIAR